jgi:hypothetical protein|tara:strand:- start:781 stop:1332 length:552 start_codon:yes stop_codon:yes gene_type:complete
METIDSMNVRLKELFGRDIAGRPNFRLVWSENEFETRIGNFEDWSPSGDIFLRSFKGARTVPKYQVEPCWTLERLYNNEGNPELLDKISYEPLWHFQQLDKEGNQLRPVWRAVELIMHTVLYGPKQAAEDRMIIGSPEAQAEMVDYYKEVISDNSPYLASMLSMGEAAAVQGRRDEIKEGTAT